MYIDVILYASIRRCKNYVFSLLIDILKSIHEYINMFIRDRHHHIRREQPVNIVEK
jgi:hypothetical protein